MQDMISICSELIYLSHKNLLTSKLGNDIMILTSKLVRKVVGFMNKEEILKKSREENKNKDIYELEVISKAQRIGGLIALFVTFALMLIERVILECGTNYGYFLIILSAGAGLWIYKAIKMKKKHEIFLAILWIVLAIYAAIMVILDLIG